MSANISIPKNKRNSLGRGLSELLSGNTAASKPENVMSIPVTHLQPGHYQPRHIFEPEALAELADSIRAQGILQPLLVRKLAGGQYEIVAGERRWRAAQMAGLNEVPVFIRDIDASAALAMGLIENIQREDLQVMEQAQALKRLIDEFTLTHDQVAQMIGKSRASISNLLRLLQLEPPVKLLVEKGALSMGHARALLNLPAADQIRLAHQVVAQDLSVRATEALVQKAQTPIASKKPSISTSPDVQRLALALGDKLGAKVNIQHQTQKNKGKMVIYYYSLDELDGILERIG
ncbi:MAG: ParB/RepB/Spo0J family partition protein [Gammaproteobacteria bacterium]